MAKNKVKVNIASKSYTIIGEDSTEHMIMVGQLVDASVREISANYQALSISDRAVLAAINVADEYIKTREKLMKMVEELTESEQSLIMQLGDMTSRVEGMKVDLANLENRAIKAETALAEMEQKKADAEAKASDTQEPPVTIAEEKTEIEETKLADVQQAEPTDIQETEPEEISATEPEPQVEETGNDEQAAAAVASDDLEAEGVPEEALEEVEVNLDEMGWSGFETREETPAPADPETETETEKEVDTVEEQDDSEETSQISEEPEEPQAIEEPEQTAKMPEMDDWGDSDDSGSWEGDLSKGDDAEQTTEKETDSVPFYVEEEDGLDKEPESTEADLPAAPQAEETEPEKADEPILDEQQASDETKTSTDSDFYEDEPFMDRAPKLDDWATPSQTEMTIDSSVWDMSGMETSSAEQDDVKVDDFENTSDEQDAEEVVLNGQTRFELEDEANNEDEGEAYPDTSMLDKPGFDYNEDED